MQRQLFSCSKMANVIKDIGEIWTRLFDHRPFLNGEIRHFLQEFEEKRGNREIERLLETLQNLTEIKYTKIDRIKVDAEINLQNIKQKVDKTCSTCNNILKKEATFKSDLGLQEKKEIRKANLWLLTNEIEEKCAKVDEEFTEEEKKVYNNYCDLEKKLHSI